MILFWVTLESLFIKRLTVFYLFRFSIPATMVILLGMIGFLTLYVWLRLKRIERGKTEAAEGTSDREEWICRSLLRLPSELFWGTVAYGGLFIPIYHIVHYLVEGHSVLRIEEYYWLNFIRSFLYELAIALTAAILHFTISRRLIRPMLISLSKVKGKRWRDKSFLSMLTTTFAGLLLVNLFSILWYVMVANAKNMLIEIEVLVPLIMLDSIFAATIFILLTFEFRRELQVLIGSIRDWLNGESSMSISRMPILSHDEVGQLAMVFNRLQDQVNQEYQDLRRELQMARKVQLQLLPASRQFFENYEVQALSESRSSVGNGFYDIILLESGGFAAVVGGINGTGMSAALQMSAVVLLLRAEIEQGGTPEEMLVRFRYGLQQVFPQEGLSSLALILVNTQSNIIHAALQGSMNARRIQGDHSELLSSNAELTFYPGDLLLMYSEPAVEAAETIARESRSRPEFQLPLEERLGMWTNRFKTSPHLEDEAFTMLLITRGEMEVSGE